MSYPILHAPSTGSPLPNSSSVPFRIDKLLGRWYITHTTSPVWRDKRNVVLTYIPLPSSSSTLPSSSSTRPVLDDLITYQMLTSSKLQTMRGTDTPSPSLPNTWTWRGNGWLKFVKSQWEVLGHDDLPADAEAAEGGYVVVFAQKSLFTPAVLNICTRGKRGLKREQLETLKSSLKALQHEELSTLTESLYNVLHE